MAIVVGSTVAGRHRAGAVAEGSRLIHKQEREWVLTGKDSQSPPPVTLLQQGHTSESFPNISTSWVPSIRMSQCYGGRAHWNHHSGDSYAFAVGRVFSCSAAVWGQRAHRRRLERALGGLGL